MECKDRSRRGLIMRMVQKWCRSEGIVITQCPYPKNDRDLSPEEEAMGVIAVNIHCKKCPMIEAETLHFSVLFDTMRKLALKPFRVSSVKEGYSIQRIGRWIRYFG